MIIVKPVNNSLKEQVARKTENRFKNEKRSSSIPAWYQKKLKRIPVSVVTGFLGAGKTTLLNHILHTQHGRKVAVIVNEFGEVGIDNKLVEGTSEELIVMNNGCICCTVRGDLIRALIDLSSRETFESVLIETTGLADPAPVAQIFFMAANIQHFYELNAFVTVVDALNVKETLPDNEEAKEQIAFADILLINKTDLVDTKNLEHVHQLVRSINPFGKIYHTQCAEIDVDKILDVYAFDLNRKFEIDPSFLEENTHKHNSMIGSIFIQDARAVDLNKFRNWMQGLLLERGADILRMKGILNVYDSQNQFIFQGVRMLSTSATGRSWIAGEEKLNQIVFIGRNLDRSELFTGFERCLFNES